MSEMQRLLDEQAMRDAEKRVEAENWQEYQAQQKQKEKAEAIAKEDGFREALLRELRIMNRLKAIEILTGRDITTLGQDYSFLIYVSLQKIGGEYDVVDHN